MKLNLVIYQYIQTRSNTSIAVSIKGVNMNETHLNIPWLRRDVVKNAYSLITES